MAGHPRLSDKNQSDGQIDTPISAHYTRVYLRLNQAAYAIVAFPIGTVLSIAPIFLNEKKNVSIPIIGWMMAAGEIFGIIAMKIAETSKKGFLFPRPHDLHFINISVALALMLIPVPPPKLWYLSGLAMILVQTFNSASKPVVGESMHRLATLTNEEPNRIFAKANMWRRIGNAIIGAAAPMAYTLFPASASFYAIGFLIILFSVVLIYNWWKINTEYDSFLVGDGCGGCEIVSERRKSTLVESKFASKKSNLGGFISFENDSLNSDDETGSKSSTIGKIRDFIRLESSRSLQQSQVSLFFEKDDLNSDDEEARSSAKNVDPEPTSTSQNGLGGDNSAEKARSGSKSLSSSLKTVATALSESVPEQPELLHGDNEQIKCKEDATAKMEASTEDIPKKMSYFLIVEVFPFFDAAISRLPFVFLTVAIAKQFNMTLASCILFSYQLGRAISQFIQAWHCTPGVGYILNAVALCAYIALVSYVEAVPSGTKWFVPFAFTGLAETLPVQQAYLIRLYGTDDGDCMNVRRAVKASHTATGVGSMAAFLIGSHIYSAFGVRGTAYVGLLVETLKIATNVFIDLEHHYFGSKSQRNYASPVSIFASDIARFSAALLSRRCWLIQEALRRMESLEDGKTKGTGRHDDSEEV